MEPSAKGDNNSNNNTSANFSVSIADLTNFGFRKGAGTHWICHMGVWSTSNVEMYVSIHAQKNENGFCYFNEISIKPGFKTSSGKTPSVKYDVSMGGMLSRKGDVIYDLIPQKDQQKVDRIAFELKCCFRSIYRGNYDEDLSAKSYGGEDVKLQPHRNIQY